MTLPANLNDLTAALARVQDFTTEAVENQALYIKMGKDGIWTYGTDEMEIEEGSQWAVNPESFATGFSAFDSAGSRVGEEMRLMTEPPILRSDLATVNGSWGPQVGFGVKCLNGEDEGLQGLIYQRSRGGLEASKALLAEVLKRIQETPEECVAIIELEVTSYKHAKYGKIYKPQFKIVEWARVEGDELAIASPESEQEPEPEPEPEPAPTRRRRRRTA